MIITYIAYTTIDLRLPEKSDKYHWSASVFFGNNESSKRRARGGGGNGTNKFEYHLCESVPYFREKNN